MSAANTSAAQAKSEPRKRGCLFSMKRGLKGLGITLVVLVLLGVGYQNIASEIDKRNYPPRGELYNVNGHQMHMVCLGEQSEGRPTVILQAGGAAESLWWYRVQNQLAEQTQVCAYDRAGLGWSEAVATPRDPVVIVGELHALLEQAGVSAPYVMAGHSYGAILARVYAAKYPGEIEGLALVDSMPMHVVEQSEIENARVPFYAAYVPMWMMSQLGLMRFNVRSGFEVNGYPAELVPELAAMQARPQTLETDEAEKGLSGVWALMHASAAATDFGDLPTVVLWASESYATYGRENNDEIAGYSSNSVTRVIDGANHLSILGTESYVRQVSDAILAVIEAAQTGDPLTGES
ncbi:MAG: alpha/beta hydrolase [Anaerolineae bacterium]|nr:alpha/beta hydrolase [Anaerolineae bacterium]